MAQLLGGELGKGTFGTVYKALHTVTGEFVAIKEIKTHGTEDMSAVMVRSISISLLTEGLLHVYADTSC